MVWQACKFISSCLHEMACNWLISLQLLEMKRFDTSGWPFASYYAGGRGNLLNSSLDWFSSPLESSGCELCSFSSLCIDSSVSFSTEFSSSFLSSCGNSFLSFLFIRALLCPNCITKLALSGGSSLCFLYHIFSFVK